MSPITSAKYKIETLPVTNESRREKRLTQERGELVLLSDGEEIRHITFFTLLPGPGFFRGGHYHRKKTEKFYIVSGKVQLFLVDVETKESEVLELEAGRRVILQPMCAHKFAAISPVQVIEYYSTVFDVEDELQFGDFTGE